MRGTILIALAALLAAATPAGAIEFSGPIMSDTTWTLADSPVNVVGNVTLRFGATLTIEPGVELVVQGNYSIECYSSGSGDIVANGAPGSEIVFRSGIASPTYKAWRGVKLEGATSSSFSHCVFEDADKGLELRNGSAAPVTSCTFRHCDQGLRLKESDSLVERSSFSDCSYTAIFLEGPTCSPVITDCNITVGALDGSQPYNVFCLDYFGATTVYVDAGYNWWGSSDINEITLTIRDVTFGGGNVNVDPHDFLSEPGVEAASWGRIKSMFID